MSIKSKTETKSDQENAKLSALLKLGRISQAGQALANAALEFNMNPEDLQQIVLAYAKKKIKEYKSRS